ncbi:MAG: hypothetical protein E7057_09440 [Lentisphaerae bacterium]|nr:hypothetical protein [Lentisphaerota bacterium]
MLLSLHNGLLLRHPGKKDLNALFRKKPDTAAQVATQVASAENLQVPPESDQSVSSVSSVPSVQTPSDTAAPVEQVGEQVPEHGKSFTKKDNAFTLDGKTLNGKEITCCFPRLSLRFL